MAQNKRLESRRQEGRMDLEMKTTMENANKDWKVGDKKAEWI